MSNRVDSIVLQLCSIVLQPFSIVLTPTSRYGEGKTPAPPPIAIFDAKLPGINCASVALNYADIIFNCSARHLEIQGGGFRSSAPIANYCVKMVSINWVSIALNCAAAIFDRTRLLSEI